MIYKEFDCEKSFGVKFLARVIFTVKSFIDFQTLHCHKSNTTTASDVKAHGYSKVWVPSTNLTTKISYQKALNNFQNEAVD